ncbi:sodium/calcium exchanger regulatory protein 1-like [Chrysoperla carnea]|uniref:sodium/calcium exchanger regulatory protein 1-like n=1 Tax=Chrysoperla carnea TaxID=189513 RepID=UPI001D092403|nr:sodium/calcium exchanger regulatory protein 1-like [Chrysoperla carnea]XP_044731677.1 sodium/calcium exchanger regulatory protein 1-like [Chrysoperla carnea]
MAGAGDRETPKIVGIYKHSRNENLDEYFKAVGVPYLPRKMMLMSSPTLEISYSSNDKKWTIKTCTLIRTVELNFTEGEEYEEHMPSGVTLKNVTTLEDGKLVTKSVGPNDTNVTRTYECTENECILTMEHEKSAVVGKRFFTRTINN